MNEPAPRGCHRERRTLRVRGETVAVPGGLAAEGDRSTGPQHASELRERSVELGQVMQHGVPENEVERVVTEYRKTR